MQTHGRTMIRQTIELLFEEERNEPALLDGMFSALLSLAQGFQVPPEALSEIVNEIHERKRIESGVVAARLMNLIRNLREGNTTPYAINEIPIFEP